MKARKLIHESDLVLVRRLLHDVYIRDLGWKIAAQNPSGIVIEKDKEGFLCFRDAFERHSTVFGVFENDVLVGSIRLVRPVEGKLEVEQYRKLPSHLRSIPEKKLEANRMVIRSDRKSSPALVHLLHVVAEHLAQADCNLLFAALSEPEPATFCTKLGFTPSELDGFRYNSNDFAQVKLHHLDCTNKDVIEKIIGMCSRIIGT